MESWATPPLADGCQTARFAAIASRTRLERNVNQFPKTLLAIIFTVAVACFSSASNIYVAQNLTGGDTGADCADAHSAAWFNTAANWGAGANQIGPGTTVHACGTFTGSAGGTMLTFRGSGTSGNPVTLLFESGADFTAPYWSATQGAISCTGQSFITIDGGTNGKIENTANGTALANHQLSQGMEIDCNNATIKNLTITNIYVRTANSTDSVDSACLGVNGVNNLLVTGNTLNRCRVAFGAAFCNNSNYEISSNQISFADHGITVGTGSSNCKVDTVKIHDNDIGTGAYVWDGAGCPWHHDGMHIFGNVPGNDATNVMIYNNFFHGLWSNDTALGQSCLNAYIYFEDGYTDPLIFNNVMEMDAGTMNYANNGLITLKHSIQGSGGEIYNNTITGQGMGLCFLTQNNPSIVGIKNNVFSNCGYAPQLDGSSSVANASGIDHNLYFGAGVGDWTYQSNSMMAFNSGSPNWQALAFDAKGQNGKDPKLDANFKLQTGSAAIGAGVNLASLGIPLLNTDKAGAVRPANGNWDVGAYQFASGGGPQAPTGLVAAVH